NPPKVWSMSGAREIHCRGYKIPVVSSPVRLKCAALNKADGTCAPFSGCPVAASYVKEGHEPDSALLPADSHNRHWGTEQPRRGCFKNRTQWEQDDLLLAAELRARPNLILSLFAPQPKRSCVRTHIGVERPPLLASPEIQGSYIAF